MEKRRLYVIVCETNGKYTGKTGKSPARLAICGAERIMSPRAAGLAWGCLGCGLPGCVAGCAGESSISCAFAASDGRVTRCRGRSSPVWGLTFWREWGILFKWARYMGPQDTQRYRSGYNGPDSKTKGHFGTCSRKNLDASTVSGYYQRVNFSQFSPSVLSFFQGPFLRLMLRKICGGIEVVITGLIRNQFVGNYTWVRIPPAAPKISLQADFHRLRAFLLPCGQHLPAPMNAVG